MTTPAASELSARPLLLTFDRLVTETTQQLVRADSQPKIDPDFVRHVLQDAGIDECLRHAVPAAKGQLLVERVRIIGEKRRNDGGASKRFDYQRALGPGLWAWVGANGSGKSTILNCIFWALTGADGGISKRVRGWLQDIGVCFRIGDDQFTSRVSRIAGEGISGGVYQGYHSFDALDLGFAEAVVRFNSRDDMRDALDLFFMNQLGITSLRWTAHSPQKDDPDLHAHSTTWRTYAHAVQIEDDSYDDLIIDPQKGYGRQDRKILEMMLGVDHARAVAEIQVQADFAKEAHARARSRVSGKQSGLAQQIVLHQQELADLDKAIALMQNEPTSSEDDSALVATREQRAAALAEQNRISEALASLRAQRAGTERDILLLDREKLALREQHEVRYLVGSLPIIRCPHCESRTDEAERAAKAKAEGQCFVCGQALPTQRTSGNLSTLLAEKDRSIAALRKAIKNLDEEVANHEKIYASNRETVAKLGKALEASVDQARKGFTTSYTNLLVRKGQIEGLLDQLRRNQLNIADEQHEVETAAQWSAVLQTAAQLADESVYTMYQNVYSALSQMVVRLATDFGLPDLEQVIIDEKRYVKLVQGGVQISHNDLARSERVKFKVAFHLALMLIQVRAGLGKHPGFLIVDTPGTAEVDTADLVSMIRDLVNIHDEYGDQVQILMATAREETLDHLPGAIVARPNEDGFFF
jgi:energy-coupling factor transporter ATP-binding protein EcfA2